MRRHHDVGAARKRSHIWWKYKTGLCTRSYYYVPKLARIRTQLGHIDYLGSHVREPAELKQSALQPVVAAGVVVRRVRRRHLRVENIRSDHAYNIELLDEQVALVVVGRLVVDAVQS